MDEVVKCVLIHTMWMVSRLTTLTPSYWLLTTLALALLVCHLRLQIFEVSLLLVDVVLFVIAFIIRLSK